MKGEQEEKVQKQKGLKGMETNQRMLPKADKNMGLRSWKTPQYFDWDQPRVFLGLNMLFIFMVCCL